MRRVGLAPSGRQLSTLEAEAVAPPLSPGHPILATRGHM